MFWGKAKGSDPVEAPESEASPADAFIRIKNELHRRLIARLDLSAIDTLQESELRQQVRAMAEELCRRSSHLLNQNERKRLVDEVMDETFGLGPLEPLLGDPTISDILINGPKTVFVERRGRLERTAVAFTDDQHLLKIIQRIVGRVGRRVDETTPMVDARLADGSRFNAIIPPLALDGPLVSIRRFGTRPLQVDDLLTNESLTPGMMEFLSACIKGRINVLISGGTGSGKTTLLNVLSRFVPNDERLITIEDACELQLQQPHVIRMETRSANIEGKGAVPARELVRNALRMRPDRIIIGECRAAEALDMMQAMNTGHEGSLTTIHANSPRDVVSRLEMMVGMAGLELPIWIIRRQIASAIQLVVQVARLKGGARKVVKISEVTGLEPDAVGMHDIFEFKQTGVREDGLAKGFFSATGVRPHCLTRLQKAGFHVPLSLFENHLEQDRVPSHKGSATGTAGHKQTETVSV